MYYNIPRVEAPLLVIKISKKTSPQSWRFYFALRRRNTRYKNPQLVAQHCFVASFRRCFPFFTLRDQLVAQQKHLLRVKKIVAKSRARVYFEQQILALLLGFHETHKLSRNKFARALQINQSARRISLTRNKCFCCGSSSSSKVKNAKHRPKLATKQCCATS